MIHWHSHILEAQGGLMKYHLILASKHNGSSVCIMEVKAMKRHFSDDVTALEFYETQIRDLSLPFGEGVHFEITIFQETREVLTFVLDKPLPPLEEISQELIYA